MLGLRRRDVECDDHEAIPENGKDITGNANERFHTPGQNADRLVELISEKSHTM